MSAKVEITHRINDVDDLPPAPINPEWVLDGAPVARSLSLSRSADGVASTSIWDCTAGRFRWYFGGDEVVHILEGEVTVSCPTGRVETLRPGDVAHFPAGSWSEWSVPNYVKKLAFGRVDRGLVGGLVYRAKQVLKQAAGKVARLRARALAPIIAIGATPAMTDLAQLV